MTAGKPIPIRLDDETLQRLEALRGAMAKSAGDAQITRAIALRAVIARGLSKLEDEFDLAYRPKPKPKRK